MSRPHRIMHLLQGLEVGGAEKMAVDLVRQLDRSVFSPSVCCFDVLGPLAAALEQAAIPVTLLPRRPGLDWRYPMQLAKLLRRKRIDILHLHNPTALDYGAPAGRLAGVKCCVYTEHGRDFSLGSGELLVERLAARWVDRVVVIHDGAGEFLERRLHIPRNKIHKIHNGVDPAPFDQEADRDGLRRELGLAEPGPLVGVIGRLAQIKNHTLLFDAFKRVLQQRPDALLLIAGDGPLRQDLERRTQELEIDAQVRFLGMREDIPRLLKLLDLLVLPSHSEGLALTLIEACAASTPMVATDVGGNAEIVTHDENGLLVPPDRPDELAKSILSIIGNPARADSMGRNGRTRYERSFSLGAMVENYQLLYRRICEKKAGRRKS